MNLEYYDYRALQWFNHNRITQLDSFFISITNTAIPFSVIIGFLILIMGIFKKDRVVKFKGTLIIIGVLFNEAVVNLLKYTINRPRPFITHPDIQILTSGGSPFFPSGHTTDVFSVALIITLLFNCKKYQLILLWLWALLVCYSRIALGAHYPSDVIGAILIGTFTTLLLYRIYFRNHSDKMMSKFRL